MEEKPFITGLWGCTCHPFESWAEHDFYNKQKIILGRKYKNRHTGEIGIAERIDPEKKYYIDLFMEPYDCARCHQFAHKMNLILVEDDTVDYTAIVEANRIAQG
ncbi:hypothetical protein [Lacihabitans soyangensis]|uniref:Uncharacterized protein n=1 Tax=Lacihabitans soyangensis TaxID=869394 RepID=A0AAE3KV45_9BACT|nr:hypothetical protein [Lacihabitans soyangensis]MCP9763821.1 hypothetical protein [Lacihabitans soyangensis]